MIANATYHIERFLNELELVNIGRCLYMPDSRGFATHEPIRIQSYSGTTKRH